MKNGYRVTIEATDVTGEVIESHVVSRCDEEGRVALGFALCRAVKAIAFDDGDDPADSDVLCQMIVNMDLQGLGSLTRIAAAYLAWSGVRNFEDSVSVTIDLERLGIKAGELTP